MASSLIPHNVSVRFSALMGGFTGPLSAAGGAVSRFGRNVGGTIGTISSLGSRMEALSGRIQNLQRRMADMPRGTTPAQRQAMRDELRGLQDQHAALTRQRQAFSRLGQTATVAGVAMVAGFGLAVKAAADFDKSMSKVAAVSGATGAKLGALRKAAIDAGRDTQFSATQAADAEGELVKAGVSVSDVLGGALKGSLALAAAGEMSVADSAVVAAQAMNIFSLKGSAVTHVADVLAAGANKSAADVHGLSWSMKMGGQVAAQMGLSLEDTIGTLSAFADNALIGSDAGTSLKTMLMRLSNPTDKAASLMEDLGIQTYDSSGKFVGMTTFAGNLQGALQGLTQQQRNQALATIFGADATRAANILYKIGAKGINDYTLAVNDSGAAARVSAKMMDNLSGDVEKLKGSLETALIKSGSSANGVLRDMIQTLDFVAHGFLALPSAIQSTTVVVIGLAGAAVLLTKTGIFMINTVKDLRVVLIALGVSAERQAAIILALRGALASTASFLAGPWGVVMGLAVAAMSIWYFSKKKATKATQEFVDAIEADSGAIDENTRKAIANKLSSEGMLKASEDLGIGIPKVTDAIAGNKDAYDEIMTTIDQYIAQKKEQQQIAGKDLLNSEEGVQTLERQIEAAQRYKGKIQEVTGSMGESVKEAKRKAEATSGETNATKGAVNAIGEHVQAEDDITAAMYDSEKGADKLKKALDELAGANMALDRALIAQREEYKKTAQAADHRAGISDKERTQLMELVDANNKVVESMITDGIEGDKVVAAQNRLYDQFIKVATAMTGSKQKAQELADRYGVLKVSTDRSSNSVETWIAQVMNAAGSARHLAQRTGGDAANAQSAFRATIERSLPVLYAMAGSNARLRGQVDALARSAGTASGKMDISRHSFMAAASAMDIGAREAGKLWTKLQALKSKSIGINVNAKGEWEIGGSPASRRSSFDTGGQVPMVPGGSRAYDSVPALLRVDEHVLTPEEVDAMGGHAAVYRLRRAALNGRVQGFANGGRVATANLTAPGSASRVMAPVTSGYQAMIRMMVETMAKEIKKAMSGGSVVAAARRWIGTPYSWGGGGIGGPSYGIGRGAGTFGFDCSGLTEYAWWKGRHIDIGGTTDPQAAGSHAIGSPRPGALGFIGNPIHHVMLASDRPGYVIQAPFTGSFVQEVQRSSSNWRWPNAAGKAQGGPVTRAEMLAGKRYIMGGGDETAREFGLAGDPGKIKGYSDGGWVVGPSGTDRVLLRGTSGEFVVSPGPARANQGILEALNEGRLTTAKTTRKASGTGPTIHIGKLTTAKIEAKELVVGKMTSAKKKTSPIEFGQASSDYSKPSKPRKTPREFGTITDDTREFSTKPNTIPKKKKSGPTKLKIGGNYNKPSKPRKTPDLKTRLGRDSIEFGTITDDTREFSTKPNTIPREFGTITDDTREFSTKPNTIPKKKKKSTGSTGSTGSTSDFSAALTDASGRLGSFGNSLIRSRQWTDAFSTSMVNAVRRIDAFSGGGGGGGTVYQITIDNHGVIGSRTETDKWLRASLERLRREGKIPK